MSIWKTIIKHLDNTCAQKQSRQFSRKSPAAMGSTLENGINDDTCTVVPTKYSAIDIEQSFKPSLDVIQLAGVTNSGYGRYQLDYLFGLVSGVKFVYLI